MNRYEEAKNAFPSESFNIPTADILTTYCIGKKLYPWSPYCFYVFGKALKVNGHYLFERNLLIGLYDGSTRCFL
jgi:hypothetical protein